MAKNYNLTNREDRNWKKHDRWKTAYFKTCWKTASYKEVLKHVYYRKISRKIDIANVKNKWEMAAVKEFYKHEKLRKVHHLIFFVPLIFSDLLVHDWLVQWVRYLADPVNVNENVLQDKLLAGRKIRKLNYPLSQS